jgi:GNAT superfamily N-acetyltransferase
MKIIDLAEEHESLYFNCLIGDPRRLADAGNYKRDWYRKMTPRGLKVKLILNDAGEPVGMVQYLPIEESPATGKDLYYLLCIWVVNDKKFRGNHQKKGFGTALLAAFEEDARASGKKGVVAWGLTIPAFMPARWFKKHGYEEAERQGMQVLLWKTWEAGVAKPAWTPSRKKPERTQGKVTVACFRCGWCPEVNKAFTRTKRVVAEIGGEINFTEIDTAERKAFEEWGFGDALFIDGKEIPLGPAPSIAKIRRAIHQSQKRAAKEVSS